MNIFAGVLGLIDILAAVALFSIYFGSPIERLQAGMALGLMMKGILFISDILSILDIIIGILMFVLFWLIAPKLALAMGIWLLYKGIYAWF